MKFNLIAGKNILAEALRIKSAINIVQIRDHLQFPRHPRSINNNTISILILGIYFLLLSIPIEAQEYYGPTENLQISNNFRIYPGDVIQTEVFIVKSPLNQNLLFSSCNTLNFIPFFVSEGVYVSDDGGFNWIGNDSCTGEPITFHGGDPGITIDKNGTFILTRLGRPPFSGLFSHYSNDNGQTWSAQNAISTDDLERASLTTDPVPTSVYFGRSYAVWIKFAQPFPLMFAYTDDGSQTWSDPLPVNSPPNRSAGGDVTVGPNGEVYSCWAGVTENSPFKEILVGFASSSNGGAEWLVDENAFEINGITGVLENKDNIRVNGLPGISVDTTNGSRRGWIYIVTGQKELSPAGTDPDIILNRSTDGGLSWSEGIRVNQDELNNGKTQFFPSIHIDGYGGVNVVFYDDRNTSPDSSGVFLARSLDGGDTWKEWEISDHNFKPTPIGGIAQGYQGDNIDLTSTSTHIIPVWMDNSTGLYQIWTTPIDFSSINDVKERINNPSNIGLEQNYPNPFSGSTTIKYSLKESGFVSLKVLDVLGKEVAILVNEIKSQGSYAVDFQPSNELNSTGIYYYQIRFKSDVLTRKMLQKE